MAKEIYLGDIRRHQVAPGETVNKDGDLAYHESQASDLEVKFRKQKERWNFPILKTELYHGNLYMSGLQQQHVSRKISASCASGYGWYDFMSKQRARGWL